MIAVTNSTPTWAHVAIVLYAAGMGARTAVPLVSQAKPGPKMLFPERVV
jgi:hypothetical protein